MLALLVMPRRLRKGVIHMARCAFALLVLGCVSACDGGGGSSSPPPPVVNYIPAGTYHLKSDFVRSLSRQTCHGHGGWQEPRMRKSVDFLLLQQVDLHRRSAEPGGPVVGIHEDRVLAFGITGDRDPRERAGVVPLRVDS